MALQYVTMLSVLIWSGCLVAISFMESWLKFRAPGVTVPVGLSIGTLVFRALNRMEWFFATAILICFFLNKQDNDTIGSILYGLAVVILAMQTAWLLPALNTRANKIIEGKVLPSSSLHWYYVGGEIIKLSSLIVLSFRLFKGFTAG